MTQNEAYEILKRGNNVFITGAAGSGKTFLLNRYIEYLKQNNIGAAITASTGIAATHINGMTIHSWTGLGIRDSLDEQTGVRSYICPASVYCVPPVSTVSRQCPLCPATVHCVSTVSSVSRQCQVYLVC